MTKVATIDTRRFLALLLIAAMLMATLLAAIAPKVAFGATNGSLTGSIILGNGIINVDNVTVWTTGGSPAETTSMTPHSDYHVKIGVSNSNTMNDLTTVSFILFYDSDGTYTDNEEVGGNAAATHATFTWTNSTDTFAKDGPTGTWSCNTTDSLAPSMGAPNGIFEFHITTGDVATETVGAAHWHIHAVATDGTSPDDGTKLNLTMQWYGAITINTANVSWANANPGMDYAASDATVSVTYVSNGHFHKAIKSDTDSWSGATQVDNDSPGQQQFALKATDSDTYGEAIRFFTSYLDIGESAIQTVEAPTPETTNTIWLKTGTPFTTGTYSGAIYYQISNA